VAAHAQPQHRKPYERHV